MDTTHELRLLEIPTSDNGTEVLWADSVGGMMQVVSVPVFVHGVSRGTLVAAQQHGDRARFERVLQDSPGATVRCYAAKSLTASGVYEQSIRAEMERLGLDVGPVTVFDPEIVAIHVSSRSQLTAVTRCLDQLARRGVLQFWEMGDPEIEPADDDGDGDAGDPWQLVHPLPVDGRLARAKMH